MTAKTVMKKTALGALCLSLVGACAQKPDKIQASYVSPNAFLQSSCQSLKIERSEIISEVNKLSVEQSQNATNDAVAMSIGVILFWPALFALALTDDQKAELSQAKGNLEAIDKAMAVKNC